MNEAPGGGARFSPPDSRDWTCAAAMEISGEALPKSFAVWQPPVEKQTAGNCVAQALSNIMECREYRKTGAHRDYSVGWIYGNRDPESDGLMPGMITRNAVAKICRDGDVPRTVWECLDEMPDCYVKRLAAVSDTAPLAEKMGAYVRLYTLDECKRFIFKYGLPALITAASKEFSFLGDDSGHAVACYGWDTDGKLLYTNSWGTGGMYGDGKGKITFEQLKECWGVIPLEKSYPDVKNGQWFYDAVMEASADGIVLGYEDGTFRPDGNLSRAELAVIWQRMKRAINKMIGA